MPQEISQPASARAGKRKRYNPEATVTERPESVSIVPLGWLVTAMKKLTGRELRVLMELFAQMRRYDRRKNGRQWVTISYSNLAFLAEMDRAAISRAIKNLEDKGYLQKVETGKGRGKPSRMEMWLPDSWMMHLFTKNIVEQEPSDKKYPARHHFINRLDLNQFRKALQVGRLPARVYCWEAWLAGLRQGHAQEHRARPSWVTPPHRHKLGERLLRAAGLMPPRPVRSPKRRWPRRSARVVTETRVVSAV